LLQNWLVTDYDREIFERELDGFVPERVFDAHAHLYALDHFADVEGTGMLQSGAPVVGVDEYERGIDEILPGRTVDALFFPMPNASVDFDSTNAFTAKEVAKRPRSRAQMLIHPNHDPELIRETVRREGFVGLKPYRIFSPRRPTEDSTIEEFLPEEHVRVAHEERLTITLHIVKRRALADRENQDTLRRYAEKYPDMRLILAHSARGFNPHHTIEGIGALAGLPNIYFDTSATADPGANEAIVQTMGHHTLLFASDYPVTHQRGRPVAVGDDFVWLSPEKLPDGAERGQPRPTMTGLESLRSLKVGLTSLRLTDSQIEDVFYNNAARLLDM
jgi:glutamate-1-semialdehyde 2,1-aminomutase